MFDWCTHVEKSEYHSPKATMEQGKFISSTGNSKWLLKTTFSKKKEFISKNNFTAVITRKLCK